MTTLAMDADGLMAWARAPGTRWRPTQCHGSISGENPTAPILGRNALAKADMSKGLDIAKDAKVSEPAMPMAFE